MDVALEPDVEQWVKQEAHRSGITPEVFIATRIDKQHDLARFAAVSEKEDELLARINEGLPTTFWERYRVLIARRDSGLLTAEEHQELIRLSDQVEEKNAARAPYLLALSRLRGVSLPDLVHQLGLQPMILTQ